MALVKALKSNVVFLDVWIQEGKAIEFDDSVLDDENTRHQVSLGYIEVVKAKVEPQKPVVKVEEPIRNKKTPLTEVSKSEE